MAPFTTRLTRRHLFISSAINGAGFVLASAATVLWYFLIVRCYPSNDSGRLLLAISAAGMINLLDLGTSMGLTRLISISGNTTEDRHAATTGFRSAIRVGLSIQLLVGLAAVVIWSQLTTTAPSFWAGAAILTFAVASEAILISASALKGLCDFKTASLVSAGSALLVYGVGALLAAWDSDIWNLFIVMSIVQASIGILAVNITSRRITQNYPSKPNSLSYLRAYITLLRTSLPFFPQLLTGIFFMHAQRFIIVTYSGLESVAIVSFAYSVATRIHSIVNAFLEIIFPMAKHLQQQGINVGRLLVKLSITSALAYLVVAVVAAIVIHFVIPEAQLTFAAFALGVTFAVAAAPAFHALNGTGASAQVSACTFLSPFAFIVSAEALHSWIELSVALLLPLAYTIAMVFMFFQVIALSVYRFSHRSAG